MRTISLLILTLSTVEVSGCASGPYYDREPRDFWPPANQDNSYLPKDYWPPTTGDGVRTGGQGNALMSPEVKFCGAPGRFAAIRPIGMKGIKNC